MKFQEHAEEIENSDKTVCILYVSNKKGSHKLM